MKPNERVLDPNGGFKSFPEEKRKKEEKAELVKPKPVEDKVEEAPVRPKSAVKKKANKRAKKQVQDKVASGNV